MKRTYIERPIFSSRRPTLALYIGLTALFVFGGVGRAGAQVRGEEILSAVQHAFARSDAAAVLDRSADHLEIALFGPGTLYSRAQAQYVLQGFFKEYPPDKVVFFRPSRNESSLFVVGAYRYAVKEAPCQLFFRLRMRDTLWELREIRIERRNRE